MTLFVPVALTIFPTGIGCSPATAIRRSALVPAAPARVGRPLKPREVRLAEETNAELYSLDHLDRETPFDPRFFLHAGVSIGEHLHL